jgi:hypothetical protein
VTQNSTVAFLDHWRSLKDKSGLVPLRSKVELTPLKSALPQMMMIGTRQTAFGFRLTGSYIERLHGPNLKHHSLLTLFRPSFHKPLWQALCEAQSLSLPLILKVSGQVVPHRLAEDGRMFGRVPANLSLEIVLAPLRSSTGELDRFLGLYQPLDVAPKVMTSKFPPKLMAFTLIGAHLQTDDRDLVPAHLKLIAAEGRRMA